MDSDAPETVPPPYRSNTESILEQWYQQLWLTVPGSIHKERKIIFYFAVALIQSLRKSLGSSLTDTSNKNQLEFYTTLQEYYTTLQKDLWLLGSACHPHVKYWLCLAWVLQKIRFPRGR